MSNCNFLALPPIPLPPVPIPPIPGVVAAAMTAVLAALKAIRDAKLNVLPYCPLD